MDVCGERKGAGDTTLELEGGEECAEKTEKESENQSLYILCDCASIAQSPVGPVHSLYT